MKKEIKQKHGIRKYKAGASSVLLGLFVFFGLITEEKVSAAEILPGQSETSKKKSTGSSNDQTETNLASNNESVKGAPASTEATTMTQTIPTAETIQDTSTAHTENAKTTERDETSSTTTPPDAPPTSDKSSLESTSDNASTTDTTTSTDTTPHVTSSIATTKGTTPSYTTSQDTTVTESTENTTSSKSTGSNITSNVKVVNASIEGKEIVNPHNAERVTLKYNWAFPDGINTGDYFDFEISNNVNTHGISTSRYLPNIQNGSLIMATGQLINEHLIRYTFTDYIENKVNVTGNLSLNLFIDPKTVTHEGPQTITSTLNGQTTTKNVKIDYLEGVNLRGVSINGSIEYINKDNHTFKHIAYVNPAYLTVNDATLIGNVTNGGAQTSQPSVKIFEYIGTGTLNQSVYADTTDTQQFKDVSSEFAEQLKVHQTGYYLTVDHLSKTYVVTYEDEYVNDADELNFRTELAGYPERYPYYYTSVKWDNGVVFYKNNGTGNGVDQPIIESNDFEFIEDTGNGGMSGQNNGTMVETEENEYVETYDSMTKDISGSNQTTTIEEYEDSMPVDFEEKTTPEGMSGSNSGTVEEVDESNLVEYEEETTPEGMSGSNSGTVEEVDESNLVEYEEETTPEGMSRSNSGAVEEIDENNLVEYEEKTTPEGMSGSNSGTVEEEDTNQPTQEDGTYEDDKVINNVNKFDTPRFTYEQQTKSPTTDDKFEKTPLTKVENTNTPKNEVSHEVDHENNESTSNETKVQNPTEHNSNKGVQETKVQTANNDNSETNNSTSKTDKTVEVLNNSPQASTEANVNNQSTSKETSQSHQKVNQFTDKIFKQELSNHTKGNVEVIQETDEDKNTISNENQGKSDKKDATKQEKALPETGTTQTASGIIALMMALVGAILAFRRRKKEDK
ncbi:fibrinogen-binding adhesin SdrG C-terminal domain-containing protein [Staphylococcus ratti]|uniref:Fibrinogen-binding adhesin SdrG C-terminal domain-containing protein n=1 Tax=Staphylococcus ratti TaxID=2892440 RepID=A0ABY3PEW5_9STAP|nr:fibrinogen-binding adhesin SdrG C-terminal domain-containing protein [Staphylococcus ratti]UEX90845.1 fibrinogen-binding adhesin SdrG C-terminal domain-containing protein [Staphylococcus ratti]